EEYATDALDAGLDVLLEKPLAHSIESAKRIVEAANAADGFCMAGFNNRYANPVEVIKGHQRNGRFGDIRHIEANYIRRRGIPGRGS
ncbi:Gfo/Idh/MocA family oxidoreductase, partial [Natrialba sp. PRR66]